MSAPALELSKVDRLLFANCSGAGLVIPTKGRSWLDIHALLLKTLKAYPGAKRQLKQILGVKDVVCFFSVSFGRDFDDIAARSVVVCSDVYDPIKETGIPPANPTKPYWVFLYADGSSQVAPSDFDGGLAPDLEDQGENAEARAA
jgi:hypothetical protein